MRSLRGESSDKNFCYQLIIRIALLLLFMGSLDFAAADTWYVNNLIGKDENDGLSES